MFVKITFYVKNKQANPAQIYKESQGKASVFI